MFVKSWKDFLSGLFFFFFGFFLAFKSTRLSIWSRFGPYEGFFPLLIAVIIIWSSLIIVTKSLSLRRTQRKENILEKQEKEEVSVFKLSSYIILMILYGLLIEGVGFLITSALFLILVLKYVERQNWKMTILVGLTSIVISYLLFVYFLGVLLPRGLIKW